MKADLLMDTIASPGFKGEELTAEKKRALRIISPVLTEEKSEGWSGVWERFAICKILSYWAAFPLWHHLLRHQELCKCLTCCLYMIPSVFWMRIFRDCEVYIHEALCSQWEKYSVDTQIYSNIDKLVPLDRNMSFREKSGWCSTLHINLFFCGKRTSR